MVILSWLVGQAIGWRTRSIGYRGHCWDKVCLSSSDYGEALRHVLQAGRWSTPGLIGQCSRYVNFATKSQRRRRSRRRGGHHHRPSSPPSHHAERICVPPMQSPPHAARCASTNSAVAATSHVPVTARRPGPRAAGRGTQRSTPGAAEPLRRIVHDI